MKRALLIAPMGSVHRRFNRANITALKSLGYTVELAANFEKGSGPESLNSEYITQCKTEGIEVHSIPFERHSLFSCFKCVPALKQLLISKQFDIVHAHTETGGLLLRLAYKFKGNSRFMFTPHGMSFWKGSSYKSQLLYRPIEKWICSIMDKNIAINAEEYAILQHWNQSSAVFVHGIGLDLKRFTSTTHNRKAVREELGLSEKELLLLSVGELNDNKNHLSVMQAMSLLKNDLLHYCICGTGENQNKLLNYAFEHNLKDKVHLLGYRSDISIILQASDIFVFPSYHEGLPVSLLEAMASGLPVIASEIRGNIDIITNNRNGFLFNPCNAAMLGKQINCLVRNIQLRESMGIMNKGIVNHYSMDVVTEELKAVYEAT